MTRILEIRNTVVPIASDIRNAFIDFSKMTASVVAVITDAIVDGKPVVGYGFNSNGRYNAKGILEDRIIPRVLDADASSLNDPNTGLLCPHRVWDVAMQNEKPGGHGERSTAMGVLDMALWDALSKINEVPLYRLLADRYNEGQVDEKIFVYGAGGYYYPGKNVDGLRDEMKGLQDRGYRVVKNEDRWHRPLRGFATHRSGIRGCR